MIRRLFTLATGAVMFTAVSASAQTVNFILEKSSETGAGTFELFADVSQDDNFGLAGFAVELFGTQTNEVVAPKGFSGFLQAMIGFADNESLPDATVIFSTQNLLEADSLVTGFGQFPGTLLEVADAPGLARQLEYDAPLLLATGTYADASALSLGRVGATVLTGENDNDAALAKTDPESIFLRADFDDDGDVDGFDLGLWQTQFCETPGCGILADADGDGDSDGFDLGIWQTEFGRVLDADFDGDGDVDAFDLGIWVLPLDGGPNPADADGNGRTDAFDLMIWQDQFGRGLDESTAAVPEPATAALLTVAGGLAARRRRGIASRPT